MGSDVSELAKNLHELAVRGDITFLFVVAVASHDGCVWTDFAGASYEVAREIAVRGLADHLELGA